MDAVVAGKMNKQIAGELGIALITVKAHRAKMKRKMSAKSLADSVRLATTLGKAPIATYQITPRRSRVITAALF
jgi:FixJ family two-component response regulator